MSDTNLDNTIKPLVNKVAQSGLITIDLEQLIAPIKILEVDIKDFLVNELLLKEKEFRRQLQETDWSKYKNQVVAVHCSTDALLQQWAYMLITAELVQVTNTIYYGNAAQVKEKHLYTIIQELKVEQYLDKRVIVKGCSKFGVSDEAYLQITKKLQPYVKRLMFGEACSTVPIYKK